MRILIAEDDHTSRTVLLVEDEPLIIEVSQAMLEQLGYGVLIAGTPGEALRLAKANAAEIKLLITDVVMPEMNGRDLAKMIREIKPELECLFMSMSSHTTASWMRECILSRNRSLLKVWPLK